MHKKRGKKPDPQQTRRRIALWIISNAMYCVGVRSISPPLVLIAVHLLITVVVSLVPPRLPAIFGYLYEKVVQFPDIHFDDALPLCAIPLGSKIAA